MNASRLGLRATALVAMLATGCTQAPATLTASPYLQDPAFASLPVLAANTQIERDYATKKATTSKQDERMVKGFRSGLAIGAVGTALALGFGITSAINNRNLENGYDDGLSRERYQELKDRGKLNNRLTWISAGIGFIGWATAAILYGESVRTCGALASRAKACQERTKVPQPYTSKPVQPKALIPQPTAPSTPAPPEKIPH